MAPGWIPGARRVRSPNHDSRPAGILVDLLVIHYISLPPGSFEGDAVTRLFTNTLDCDADPSYAGLRGLRVSAHYLIRRGGGLVQFVDDRDRAWHAGVSHFQGRSNCNDFSIGIELEGSGEQRFTDAQYQTLRKLTRRLCRRHPLRWVAGHSDIAPGRKHDPGPLFDWPRYLRSIASTGLTRPFGVRRTCDSLG